LKLVDFGEYMLMFSWPVKFFKRSNKPRRRVTYHNGNL